MAILTYIDGQPLYTTLQEAIDYGNEVGLQGYHTHNYNGILGYMAGTTHGNATRVGYTSRRRNQVSRGQASTSTNGNTGSGGY
jgi:hypothetical protein